jgi:hypothetical protein
MFLHHELMCSGLAHSDGREHVIQSDGASKCPLPESAHSQKRSHYVSLLGPPKTDTVLNDRICESVAFSLSFAETFQNKLYMDGNNFPK